MAEFVSTDILDEELTKVFGPIRVLQTLLGARRVDIRDRFVTPPSFFQKLYTLFVLLLCINAFLFMYTILFLRFIQNRNMLILAFLIIVVNFSACFFNVLYVTFFRNDENVQFYKDLQIHDRAMKIHQTLFVDRALYIENMCIVVIYSSTIVVFYSIALLEDINFWTYIGLVYTQSVCTMEWLYFSNLIKYFITRVNFINGIMFNHFKTKHEDLWSMYEVIFSNKEIKHFEASEGHDFETTEIEVYVKNFLGDFKKFQDLYQFQMFLFCVKLVLNYCVVVEWALLGISSTVMKPVERIVVPLSGVSDASILVLICVNFEILFGQIKKTKYLSTTVMSIYYKGPLRAKARKTIKFIEDGPKHFSVYDLWRMDFSTVFSIINIVTNFIVTLLQFFFL